MRSNDKFTVVEAISIVLVLILAITFILKDRHKSIIVCQTFVGNAFQYSNRWIKQGDYYYVKSQYHNEWIQYEKEACNISADQTQ